MSEDSSREADLSETQRWSLLDGIGGVDSVRGAGDAGRRKGRAPLGDAWLFEATVACSIPMNLKYACLVDQHPTLLRGGFLVSLPAISDSWD